MTDSTEVGFGQGTHFEERLVHALLADHGFAEQMTEVLSLDYFSLTYLKEITKIIFEFYRKYKSFPSTPILVSLAQKMISNDIVKEQAISYFTKIKNESLNGDLEYIKETSLEFCKKQKFILALEKALELAQSKKYEQVAHEIQKALQAGSERDVGHIYDEHFEARMTQISRSPIPTGWAAIDNAIGGGLSSGELGVLMALTGVGKTHGLVDIGSNAAMIGKNVLHVTFELSDLKTSNRYDANISKIPFNDLLDRKEEVRTAVDNLRGKIVVKKYPTKTATCQTIRTLISKLRITKDFVPDIVIVDYADIMRSTAKYENRRMEEESVYEELRALAEELHVPVWTASQTNRGGYNSEVLTLQNVAECFNKAMVSDVWITMNRKKEPVEWDLGNMYIAKSRVGADGIKFAALFNTSISEIEVIEPNSPREAQILLELGLMQEDQEKKIKDRIKKMLHENDDE